MKSQSGNETLLNCWIYKSLRKEEMYLYLVSENGFEEIPEPLQQSFGTPVFVMELELSEQRKLARAEVSQVMMSLRESGYYLQLPPEIEPDLHFGD